MAIRSFADEGTADIAQQRQTKRARRTLPVQLHRAALEKLVLLHAAMRLDDLAVWPSLNLEKLKGNRKGQHSIRVNRQYRICLVWRENAAFEVAIVDYH